MIVTAPAVKVNSSDPNGGGSSAPEVVVDVVDVVLVEVSDREDDWLLLRV